MSRSSFPPGARRVSRNAIWPFGHALCEGGDADAGLLRETLGQTGVEAELTVDASRPTKTKTRIVAQSQQVVRADAEDRSPIAQAVADEVASWIAEHDSTDALVLSDYAKGPRLA